MTKLIEFDDINDLIAYRIAKAAAGFKQDCNDNWYNYREDPDRFVDMIGLYIAKNVRILFFEALEFAEKLSEDKKDKIEITYSEEIDIQS